jgi:hypothetical protein
MTSCPVCSIFEGDVDSFNNIAEEQPRDLLLNIMQCTSPTTKCYFCFYQNRHISNVFALLCNRAFAKTHTIAHNCATILDKIMELAVEHLPNCDLTYSMPIDFSKPLPLGFDCTLKFSQIATNACLGNDVIRAEKIFSVASALGLDLSNYFGDRAMHGFAFSQEPLGEGFAFYLKHCKLIDEEDVLNGATWLRNQIIDPTNRKAKFYIFFDFAAKHKLSKQAVADYVAKNKMYFS